MWKVLLGKNVSPLSYFRGPYIAPQTDSFMRPPSSSLQILPYMCVKGKRGRREFEMGPVKWLLGQNNPTYIHDCVFVNLILFNTCCILPSTPSGSEINMWSHNMVYHLYCIFGVIINCNQKNQSRPYTTLPILGLSRRINTPLVIPSPIHRDVISTTQGSSDIPSTAGRRIDPTRHFMILFFRDGTSFIEDIFYIKTSLMQLNY